MGARTITLSRQVGTGGDEIAYEAARLLGLVLVDNQVVQAAADAAGVSPETIGEAEHAASLMDRILGSLAVAPSYPGDWSGPPALATSPLFTSDPYRQLIERVLHDLADRGQCLIVGHAAHIVLRPREDVLRVLVIADAAVRVRRLVETGALDEQQAQSVVERSDKERTDYFHQYYQSSWLGPENYDLCINTSAVSDAQAVQLIAAAAQQFGVPDGAMRQS